MFGIGGFELVLILLFGFLIFGPEKLPAIAKTVGKGIAKFRAAQQDMSEVLKESDAFDPNSDEPFKDPTETIDKLASTAEKHMRSAVSETTTAVKSKTHDTAAQPAVSAPSVTAAPKPAAAPAAAAKSESFTERKARYERERAARLAAEAASAEARDSVESSKAEAAEAASVEVADSGKSSKNSAEACDSVESSKTADVPGNAPSSKELQEGGER